MALPIRFTPRRSPLWALATVLATVLATALPAHGQTTFGGQVRTRSEARDPVDGGTLAFTSMRTRAQLLSGLANDVTVFVQFQDVRLWGEESNTLTDFRADNMDVHQAWVEFGHAGRSQLWVRAGRQEIDLGGQRLVGSVGWSQQGRSFDGVRGSLREGRLRLDVFGVQLAEEASSTFSADGAFLGGYGTVDLGAARAMDLYVLYHRPETEGDLQRTTLGARYEVNRGPWSYRTELSYQTGQDEEGDISAKMVGARVGRTFHGGATGLTLWYDRLSGDEDADDGEAGTFNTLFATNHKFYGLADLFLDIPKHTANRGLADVALKAFRDVREDVRLNVELHQFNAVETVGLSTIHLAQEIDVLGTYRYAPGVSFTGGLAYVVQQDASAELGLLGDNVFWGFVMLSASF